MYSLTHETDLIVVAWVDSNNVKQHATVILDSDDPTEGELKLVSGWLEDAIRNGAARVAIEQVHLNDAVEVNL